MVAGGSVLTTGNSMTSLSKTSFQCLLYMEEIMEEKAGSQIFKDLDMKARYHQVRMQPQDEYKIALPDDILFYSPSLESHVADLQQVLQKPRNTVCFSREVRATPTHSGPLLHYHLIFDTTKEKNGSNPPLIHPLTDERLLSAPSTLTYRGSPWKPSSARGPTTAVPTRPRTSLGQTLATSPARGGSTAAN
jgi:hypothetical protein